MSNVIIPILDLDKDVRLIANKILDNSITTKYIKNKIKENNLDINAIINYGNTLLHIACITKNKLIFNFLISKKMCLTIKNDCGNTLLHEACASGFDHGCEILIKKKIDINCKNNEGNTAIHLAIYENQISIVKLLINNNADLHLLNNSNKEIFNELIKYMPELCNYILDQKCKLLCMIPSISKKNIITHKKLLIDSSNNLITFKETTKNSVIPLNTTNKFNITPRQTLYSKRRAYIKEISYDNYSIKTLKKIIKYPNLDLISHIWTETILNYYWKTQVKYIFILQIILYLIYTSIFTISTFLHKYENVDVKFNDTNTTGYFESKNIKLYIFDSLLLLFNLVNTVNEIYEINRTKKLKKYIRNKWNIFDILQNIGVYVLFPLRAFDLKNLDIQLSAFLALMFWIKLFNFCKGFKKMGPFVKVIYKMILDIYYFLSVYLIVFIGFCHAFFLLLGIRNDSYENILYTIITLFNMNIGDFEFDLIKNSEYQISSIIVFVAFNILTVIIVFNILIAILTDSYTLINSQAGKEWKSEKAILIMSLLESLYSTCLKNKVNINNIDNLYLITNKNKEKDVEITIPYYNINLKNSL